MKKTFAIETSCDDTSVWIISYADGVFSVDKLVAYSQIQEHKKFGGVVPEIAYRLHSEKIIRLIEEIGVDAIEQCDSICVTTHPGLGGSLLVGKSAAHMLGEHLKKKVLGVNHVFGHIFSILLERNIRDLPFPWTILTASGGHNEIYLVTPKNEMPDSDVPLVLENFTITKLWHTLDDASGECFDKVSRMLWWPNPGGFWIGQKALLWRPNEKVQFKRIFLDRDAYDFSFSGMKSQVHYLLSKLEKEGTSLDEQLICDIAYEFQEAVVEVLAKKLINAANEHGAKTIGIVGGVSANDRLFEYASAYAIKRFSAKELIKTDENSVMVSQTFNEQDIPLVRPMKKVYSVDNGAMIGVVGLMSK